ncbi:putative late blight resistance protein homolog R1B-14 [Salvia miltiorrhiza]|uniref:putative late blight resistance protein homolog R1B-14 n=1 Tax=Salvia miltiorrhiza TaxID=226208 RepID=UPI0025AC8FB5|nr:putative late blight resistance protein homolog R1B-14 [Salvia miltiorrhiza]
MAGFPEDYEICASELINLWIVEGFFKHLDESKSSEEEGEDCLEDFVKRSLVLVANRKFDGKIKSFSLHDIVREFCIRQGAKEKEKNILLKTYTLSLVTDFVWSRRMVKMTTNIKKLGICYSKEKFDLDSRYRLNNLKYLCRLEKLKLEMNGDFSFRELLLEFELDMRGGFSLRGLNFPLQLRKLTLSGWRLSWSDMTTIGSLPSLQVLKLRNFACYGTHWETTEGEFRELRLLLIEQSNLRYWGTEASHFPRLERLILHQCDLNLIPSNIGDIPTLKLIEVDDMPRDLLASAKSIEEKRRNSGNDSFQVRVKRS